MQDEDEASPSTERSATVKNPQNYACVVCAQRKVKCDRQSPCSNCVKGRVECEYRAPPPAKRKRRKQLNEHETLSILNRYEKILNNLGVDVDRQKDSIANDGHAGSLEKSSLTSPLPARPTNAESSVGLGHPFGPNGSQVMEYRASGGPESDERMFVQGRNSRYTETNMWGRLSDDVLRTKDVLPNVWDLREKSKNSNSMPSTSDQGPGSLLFASGSSQTDLRGHHPPAAQMERLWKIFRTNVDPLIKLFDINVKEMVFISDIPSQLDGTSKLSNSFCFAIYFCAVTSIEDDDCMREFGEARNALLDRYQWATEQSLIASRLINTSDVFVLQAFFLYLLCMRQRTDPGSLWTLNGVALRIALRTGLHRDAEYLDTSTWPWHAEMRRRLWWQIIIFERRTAELSGLGKSVSSSFKWDTKPPLNVNDADLVRDCVQLPPSRSGATDMIFCSIWYEFASLSRDLENLSGTASQPSADAKEKLIDELERRLEQKYLSYCDPLIPLHFLSSIFARSAIAVARFKLHHMRRQAENDTPESQADKDRIFNLALKVLEYDNLAHSTRSIRKFRFHIQNFFPWHQLMYILSELRTRTTGSDADRAWEQLEEVFEHRPDLMKEERTALHTTLTKLALRVWEARIKDLELQFPTTPLPRQPVFIETLQAQEASTAAEARKASSLQPPLPLRSFPYDPVRTDDNWRPESHSSLPEQNTCSTQTLQNTPIEAPEFPLGSGAVDPNASGWPEWDDLMFQDLNFAPGFDNSFDLFGSVL